MKGLILCVHIILACPVKSFVSPSQPTVLLGTPLVRAISEERDSNSAEEAWDANVDYEKEWPQEKGTPDPSTAWDDISEIPDAPRLGIDVPLEPLNEAQAAEIRKEAEDIINARIDEGIEDIEKLRNRMTKEMEQSRKIMQIASELDAQQKSEQLMKKIDKMTGDFLDSTKDTRVSTKMAAAASKAMEGTGQGLEIGTWGTLSGRTVIAAGSGSLLGSVDSAVQNEDARKASGSKRDTTTDNNDSTNALENRIILIADVNSDKVAKQLAPALQRRFEKADIPNCEIEILSPTAAMPLGGNNAACVVVFCTSISQASSLSSILDKLLRKTLQFDGKVGRPPTQLVGISTVGTERSDKFPYSMANLLGKLEQRRQVEEILINTVQHRVTQPPMDYTLVKLGELKGSTKDFLVKPGDSLDDSVSADDAAQAILQAVAYQPFARNSTFSVAGSIPAGVEYTDESFWDTMFLPLEGPEILRIEDAGGADLYDKLIEYVQGWAKLLAVSGKGLTTPIEAFDGIRSRSSHLVKSQDGVQLLFLPTKTGKNYLNKEEEREREAETGKQTGTAGAAQSIRKNVKEGGIDVLVEITNDEKLRIRARRCNYADDAVIKELSEETILKRLEDAINVWKKEL